jgi:hypothetical protein
MVYLPAVWLICAIVAARVGVASGHENSGFFLGLVLGPLGLAYAATRSELLHRAARRSRPAGQH